MIGAEGTRIKDRDVADLVAAGLARVVDLQGGWEARTADVVTAEEAADNDIIAIRAPASRSTRR